VDIDIAHIHPSSSQKLTMKRTHLAPAAVIKGSGHTATAIRKATITKKG